MDKLFALPNMCVELSEVSRYRRVKKIPEVDPRRGCSLVVTRSQTRSQHKSPLSVGMDDVSKDLSRSAAIEGASQFSAV